MTQLQRITFQNSRGQDLVGLVSLTNVDAIVIMAPGFCSDKSSQGRFEICARRLNASGISALAIDFSGCGESDDDMLTLEKEVDDLQSAIRWVQSKVYKKIGLYGNSLGGLICLSSYSPDIKAMAITGGGTGPMKFDWSQHFSQAQMQELQEKGYITERNAKNMNRSRVIVDQQMLKDFELVNQKQLLSNVKCPVLLIHGDADEEEHSLYQLSLTGMQYLSPTSELKLIPGAAHGFWGYIDEVANLLSGWFENHL